MIDASFLRMMLGTYSALGTLEEMSYREAGKENKSIGLQ